MPFPSPHQKAVLKKMSLTIDLKRLLIFLGFAFLISWGTALMIFLTGGLENSPSLRIENASISLATLLLATGYMFGPALANIFTRLITKEGFSDLHLKPNFDGGRWRYYLIAWFLPGILVILGMACFFLLMPKYYDPELTTLIDQISAASKTPGLSPWAIIFIQTLQALFFAPVLNALSTFGEEFGWRGYLQPKLMPLGPRKAILLTGLIWGLWHAPIILMGYNYGLDYWGAPFLGPIAMIWFTMTVGTLLGWMTLKTGCLWPAVIGHGALNGIAALGLLLTRNNPSTLLGPTPVGLIGGIGFTLMAVLILLIPKGLREIEFK